jgi:hypothetical protein
MVRKSAVGAGIVAGALFLSASSAFAFECYNANRSAQGNASAAGAAALVSPQEFLAEEVGLCPAGVAAVIAGLGDAGFATDFLINGRTIMASGLERSGHEGKLHDGQGIDHLSDDFFATADELIGEAFELCT